MSLASQAVPVLVPLSVGGTAPFGGKASAGPIAKTQEAPQWGASQDQVSLPAPSTCSSPEIWHDLFSSPGMSPPSDAEVFCKTLFALYRTSLQRPQLIAIMRGASSTRYEFDLQQFHLQTRKENSWHIKQKSALMQTNV